MSDKAKKESIHRTKQNYIQAVVTGDKKMADFYRKILERLGEKVPKT